MTAVKLERIERFIRTPSGPHWQLLKKEFHYLHKSQLREPGRPIRYISTPTDLFSELDGHLYFPCGFYARALKVLAANNFVVSYTDLRVKKLKSITVPALPGLRPGQQEVIESVVQADCGIVDALTGFGKGVLIEKIIGLYPDKKHLVTTKGKSVCNQLYTRLKAVFPQTGLWSSDKHLLGNPQVATSGSLGHLELDKFDIIQLDEVHELMTPSFLEHYPRFGDAKMISYSATAFDRLDNTALAMEGYFGPIITSVKYEKGVDLGLVVPIEVWKLNWSNAYADVLGNYSDIRRQRSGYWGNHARNNVIAKAVNEVIPQRLAEKDPQILILVDKVEHALQLGKILPDFTVVYGSIDAESAEYFKQLKLLNSAPLTKKDVDEARKKFSAGTLKRVIATGIWNTGVDFPNLSVIIRADGGASAIKDTQMPGRVCRISSGKEKGILIDSADTFDLWTARRAKSRFDNYREKGWEIVEIPI